MGPLVGQDFVKNWLPLGIQACAVASQKRQGVPCSTSVRWQIIRNEGLLQKNIHFSSEDERGLKELNLANEKTLARTS